MILTAAIPVCQEGKCCRALSKATWTTWTYVNILSKNSLSRPLQDSDCWTSSCTYGTTAFTAKVLQEQHCLKSLQQPGHPCDTRALQNTQLEYPHHANLCQRPALGLAQYAQPLVSQQKIQLSQAQPEGELKWTHAASQEGCHQFASLAADSGRWQSAMWLLHCSAHITRRWAMLSKADSIMMVRGSCIRGQARQSLLQRLACGAQHIPCRLMHVSQEGQQPDLHCSSSMPSAGMVECSTPVNVHAPQACTAMAHRCRSEAHCATC